MCTNRALFTRSLSICGAANTRLEKHSEGRHHFPLMHIVHGTIFDFYAGSSCVYFQGIPIPWSIMFMYERLQVIPLCDNCIAIALHACVLNERLFRVHYATLQTR